MATSITASNMTVKIVEDVTFNGSQQGVTNTVSFSDIAEYSRRIVTVPTSEVVLVNFGDAVNAGTFHNTDVRYVRITNLDNTNYVTLNFEGASSTDYSIRLDKNMGSYLILATHASLGVDDHCDISGASLEKLETIKATAISGACDLEVVVACK
tara:strand:- start:102 stop:563 length:462 start_codon:yes stop_codon:yes gene_type:complete